jgi:hypothetical protein
VHPLQGEAVEELDAGVVVLVTQNEPNRGLYDELVETSSPADVLIVGDAASPRDMHVAIAEAHRAARGIDSRASRTVA